MAYDYVTVVQFMWLMLIYLICLIYHYLHHHVLRQRNAICLTIIPRARMASESIAHEAEGRMGYWLRVDEGERNNCFSKIQLVGQKYREYKNVS